MLVAARHHACRSLGRAGPEPVLRVLKPASTITPLLRLLITIARQRILEMEPIHRAIIRIHTDIGAGLYLGDAIPLRSKATGARAGGAYDPDGHSFVAQRIGRLAE